MEWTQITVTVPRRFSQPAQDAATVVAQGGLYVEDYADLEEQVWEIAHVDLIEEELRAKPRDEVKIHMYLSPQQNLAKEVERLKDLLLRAGVTYTLATTGVNQEDWENNWKQYYHPIEIGTRLAVAPSWEEYQSGRTVLRLDPGMAFGTGTHETTYLCLELLDELVRGGEHMLDIGTGSGILGVAALLLGAAHATGVDIDPMAVKTAGENARRNHVQGCMDVVVGNLADAVHGRFELITANIVADAILALAPDVPGLLAPDGVFIASGIIDTRGDDVEKGLRQAGFTQVESRHKNGWVAFAARM